MFNEDFQPQKKDIVLENIQDFYNEIHEYYDELFPIAEGSLSFIEAINNEIRKKSSTQPAPLSRYLGIGCATGNFENKLDAIHLDITGIDKNSLMIETAMRRMKRTGTTNRFFEMAIKDICTYLQKESFQIITCLENTLPYLSDQLLMEKFFDDAKKLLAPGGRLIIQTDNFDSFDCTKPIILPEKSSTRVRLTRSYIPAKNNKMSLKAELELGNGNKIMTSSSTQILPTSVSLLTQLAKNAGLSTPRFYGDFNQSEWTEQSPMTIVVF